MEHKPSTEQLLELLKYYNADDLKRQQTNLTKAANQLRETVSSKLGTLFSEEEQQVLMQAAGLLGSLKTRVERAKEVKQQDEARKKKEWEELGRLRRQIANLVFPLPTDTDEDLVALLEFNLALGERRVLAYRPSIESSMKWPKARFLERGTIRKHISCYRHDCQEAIAEHWECRAADSEGIEREMMAFREKLEREYIPHARAVFKDVIEFFKTEMAIEVSDNVTRLSGKGQT